MDGPSKSFSMSARQVRALVHEYRARVFMHTRSTRDAKREMKLLLETSPTSVRTVIFSAQLEFLRGNFAKSLRLLNVASYSISSSFKPERTLSSSLPLSPTSTSASPPPSSLPPPTPLSISPFLIPPSASSSSAATALSSSSSSLSLSLSTSSSNPPSKTNRAAPSANPLSSFLSLSHSLHILSNSGCVHRAAGKPHMGTIFFSKALKITSSLSQLFASAGALPIPNSSLNDNKFFEIIFNFGLHQLLVGNPLQASRCFLEALGLYHSRPSLWLRLAECCVVAHEQGLLPETGKNTKEIDASEDGSRTASAQQAPDAGGKKQGLGRGSAATGGGGGGKETAVITVVGEGRWRKVVLPSGGMNRFDAGNLYLRLDVRAEGEDESSSTSSVSSATSVSAKGGGVSGAERGKKKKEESGVLEDSDGYPLASVPAKGQKLSLEFARACLRNAIVLAGRQEAEEEEEEERGEEVGVGESESRESVTGGGKRESKATDSDSAAASNERSDQQNVVSFSSLLAHRAVGGVVVGSGGGGGGGGLSEMDSKLLAGGPRGISRKGEEAGGKGSGGEFAGGRRGAGAGRLVGGGQSAIAEAMKKYEEERRNRLLLIRACALTQLAYVELCLGNFSACLAASNALLKVPGRRPSHSFVVRMYAAEALCRLGQVDEGAEHLSACLTDHVARDGGGSASTGEGVVGTGGREKVSEESGGGGKEKESKSSIFAEGASGGSGEGGDGGGSVRGSGGGGGGAEAGGGRGEDSDDEDVDMGSKLGGGMGWMGNHGFHLTGASARASLFVNMAAVYAMKGDVEQALACASRALMVAPDNLVAGMALVYGKLRQGQYSEAVDILARCRKLHVVSSSFAKEGA